MRRAALTLSRLCFAEAGSRPTRTVAGRSDHREARELERTLKSPDGLGAPPGRACEGCGVDSPPHDFRRTVATQVARESTLANATALLGHSDESTTARHYVQRLHVAPDLRVIIDQLVAQAPNDALEGPIRRVNGGSGMTKGPTAA